MVLIVRLLWQGATFVSGAQAAAEGVVNEAVPEEELHDAVLAYASIVAKQGSYQNKLCAIPRPAGPTPHHALCAHVACWLRRVKLAFNNVQENQGFTSHIKGWLGQWVAMMMGLPKRDPGSKRLIPADKAAEARRMRPKL